MRLRIDNPAPGVPVSFEMPRRTFTVGRREDVDWCLPDASRSLSSIHCEFRFIGDRYALIDRSRNGTSLNGARLDPEVSEPLQPGDHILAGPYTIVFEDADVRAPREETAFGAQPPSADLVGTIAAGANIAEDILSDRSPDAIADETGRILRIAFDASRHMDEARRRMTIAVDAKRATDERAVPDLEAAMLQGEPLADEIEASLTAFLDHDRAMFAAMQTALFQLLNELSPETIEADAGSSARKRWTNYEARWRALVMSGEHGLLDAFLERFRAAYDAQTH